jgi:hypothetical protein
MDLFSFTSIIIILFLIIGLYILATGQIEGRAQIVLVIALLIVFIVIIMNLDLFKTYTKGITYPTPTTKTTFIGDVNTPYELSTSYSLSMWIYISDWNNNLGANKIIVERLIDTTKACPNISLNSYKNTLTIDYEIYKTENTAGDTKSGPQIVVENIGIQKWVNITVCFGDNKIDTYINGKLEKSSLTANSQYVPTTGTHEFIFNPNSEAKKTYNGYISKTRYYSRFLSPQECWDIYSEGFSDSLFGNFLNQYNATFIFQKGQEELYKIPLM